MSDLKTKVMLEALDKKIFTIVCTSCSKPLWIVKIGDKYGTRWSSKETAFPGVFEYREAWSKNRKDLLKPHCPFCAEPWLKALKGPNGVLIAKPKILEIDGLT